MSTATEADSSPRLPNSRERLLRALVELHLYVPEDTTAAFMDDVRERTGAGDGDENMPLLSEAQLYPLLGKESARTFMVLLRDLVAACGFDELEFERVVRRELESRLLWNMSIDGADPKRVVHLLRDAAGESGSVRILKPSRDGRMRALHMDRETCRRAVEALDGAGLEHTDPRPERPEIKRDSFRDAPIPAPPAEDLLDPVSPSAKALARLRGHLESLLGRDFGVPSDPDAIVDFLVSGRDNIARENERLRDRLRVLGEDPDAPQS